MARGLNSGLATVSAEIEYRLRPSRDMTEIALKWHNILHKKHSCLFCTEQRVKLIKYRYIWHKWKKSRVTTRTVMLIKCCAIHLVAALIIQRTDEFRWVRLYRTKTISVNCWTRIVPGRPLCWTLTIYVLCWAYIVSGRIPHTNWWRSVIDRLQLNLFVQSSDVIATRRWSKLIK